MSLMFLLFHVRGNENQNYSAYERQQQYRQAEVFFV